MNQAFWNETVKKNGHTGFSNQLYYKYDQPIRIRSIWKIYEKYSHIFYGNQINILDIGTGTGDFIELFSKINNVQIQAYDISTEIINITKKRFKKYNNIKISQSNTIDFDSNLKYQIINSVTVMQHLINIDDLNKSLNNIHNLLAENGIFIMLELSPKIMSNNSDEISKNSYIVKRNFSEWITILENNNFSIQEIWTYPQNGIILNTAVMTFLSKIKKKLINNRFNNNIRNKVTGQKIPVIQNKKFKYKNILIFTIFLMTYFFDNILKKNIFPNRFTLYRIYVIKKNG